MNKSYTGADPGATARTLEDIIRHDTLLAIPDDVETWYYTVPDHILTDDKVGTIKAREALVKLCASVIEDAFTLALGDPVENTPKYFKSLVRAYSKDELDYALAGQAFIQTLENEQLEFDAAVLKAGLKKVIKDVAKEEKATAKAVKKLEAAHAAHIKKMIAADLASFDEAAWQREEDERHEEAGRQYRRHLEDQKAKRSDEATWREQIKSGIAWHLPILKLVGRYVAKGLESDEILDFSEAWTQPGYTHEQTRETVQVMIDGAREKGFDRHADQYSKRGREAPAPKLDGLKFYSLAELADRQPPEFLIEDLFPKNGVGIIAGESGAMKSFCVIHLGFSCALGLKIGDKAVKQTDVLFLNNEGLAGFPLRCSAWRKHHKQPEPDNIRIAEVTPNLIKEETIKPFIKLAEEMEFRPGLIIIDTFNKASLGSNDNDTSEMALALNTADRLARHFDGLVLLFDHVGKDAKKGLRGAYSKFANADMVGMVSKSGEMVTLKTDKQKEGEDNITFDFRINKVEMPGPNKSTLEVPALSLEKSGRLPPQKDFIISTLDLEGPLGRDQLGKHFTKAYGADKRKSLDEQLRRLKKSNKITETNGVIEIKE